MLRIYRRHPDWTIAAVYSFLGLLLSGALWHHTFLSDDFQVIYRVATTHQVFYQGFFRPLSDLSILLNYWVGGFNPFGYFLFNLSVHISCSFLLYRLVQVTRSLWGISHPAFPVLSGALFLVYPYHGEALFWVVGRGASLATLFGLCLLHISLSKHPLAWRLILVSVLYFIGMGAYETLLPLPLLLLGIHYFLTKESFAWKSWLVVLGLTLAVHLLVRRLSAGAILGDYAAAIFSHDVHRYFGNLFRILARLYVPPMVSTPHFLATVAVVAVLLGIGFYRYRVVQGRGGDRQPALLRLMFLLCVSLIVPVTFAVSTHTSESDRLLYFPSVWACLLLSVLVCGISRSNYFQGVAWVLLLSTSVYLLQHNFSHWRRAADTTTFILETIQKEQATGRKTVWVNLPGEDQGAYIFRHGFEEALLMKGLDTGQVKSLNIVDKKAFSEAELVPVIDERGLHLPPAYWVTRVAPQEAIIQDGQGKVLRVDPRETTIWYWNLKSIKPIAWREP